MSKLRYDVRVLKSAKINELQGAWDEEAYSRLATLLDCPVESNASLTDLKELCEMYMSDQ